jgi:hypothetical protein
VKVGDKFNELEIFNNRLITNLDYLIKQKWFRKFGFKIATFDNEDKWLLYLSELK